MRVLLIGAYGFIGSEIARALMVRDHAVAGFGRNMAYGRRILPDVDWIAGDLSDFTDTAAWRPLLTGIDVVINASGLLQDERGHSVGKVQTDAIVALIGACVSPLRFVQISAANADEMAPTTFLRSKAVADRRLGESGLAHIVIRPGLVIGRNAYGGTELIRTAAAMPIVTIVPRGGASIQCTALDDLVAAVTRSAEGVTADGSYDLVEPHARSLSEIVALHRGWLGLAPAWRTILLGGFIMRLATGTADLLGRLGWRSPLRSNAVLSLMAGISGDAGQGAALLGRMPQSLEAILAKQAAGKQDRLAARIGLLLPLALMALFLMWMGTAIATMMSFDAATALLRVGGLSDHAAQLLGGGGAIADALLAMMLLHRRTVRTALISMTLLTFAYLVGASLIRPDFWGDPLAPLLKTLPAALLALMSYTALERR